MADPSPNDKRAQLLQDDEKWPNGNNGDEPAANETLQTIAGMMGNVLEVRSMILACVSGERLC